MENAREGLDGMMVVQYPVITERSRVPVSGRRETAVFAVYVMVFTCPIN